MSPVCDIIRAIIKFIYIIQSSLLIIMKKTIYLDYQASTPVRSEVFEEMQPYFSTLYGNPHSNNHIIGWEANKAVEKSRLLIANSINSDDNEILFTSGATEANNLVIKGLEDYLKGIKKTSIVISSIEHKCVLESALYMKERGFNLIQVRPNNEGFVTKDALEDVMNDDVGLVSVMLVNNEIGTIEPVKELANIAHNYGALFHTDAAQANVFMKLDVDELQADFLSLSSHKAYGPKGIGALYISRDIRSKLRPLIHGGGQEDGLRSGTLPTALVVGMGKAIELCSNQAQENKIKLKNLSSNFWNQLKSKFPDIVLNGSNENRHPGNLNIQFPGIESAHFLQCMQPDIAASSGSACVSGIEAPSYVLTEIGLDEDQASSSIRFSFGIDQSEEEIRKATELISEIYRRESDITFAA